jgi:cytidyltransferase-like protein|tara:strand:+ start:328 stop:738 length:411 start_codon:yes stop_codon:yes gene_type:complete
MKKNILLDMSATLIHHGHVRLINKASKFGNVIIALTKDSEVKKYKGYTPEINFIHRKEILQSFKNVYKVVSCNFIITDNFLKKLKIDYLVHGNDNLNKVSKRKIKIFKRTEGISSTLIRKKACANLKKKSSKSILY